MDNISDSIQYSKINDVIKNGKQHLSQYIGEGISDELFKYLENLKKDPKSSISFLNTMSDYLSEPNKDKVKNNIKILDNLYSSNNQEHDIIQITDHLIKESQNLICPSSKDESFSKGEYTPTEREGYIN